MGILKSLLNFTKQDVFYPLKPVISERTFLERRSKAMQRVFFDILCREGIWKSIIIISDQILIEYGINIVKE